MGRFLVVTHNNDVRVARVSQEVVMTSQGYAQPASISLRGNNIKGFVKTADACKVGNHYFFFTEEVNNG